MIKILLGKISQLLFCTLVFMLLQCSHEGGDNNPVNPIVEVVVKNGTISNGEIWSQTDKIYRITSDCFIESQVTWGKGIVVIIDSATIVSICNNGQLIVEEGVRIKSGKGAYFDVGQLSAGVLTANGSAAFPISFEAIDGNVWGLNSLTQSGGIILGDSANNIQMNYCIITGATAGIFVKTGSPVIVNCQVMNCQNNGIYFDSSAGPSDHLHFVNNTVAGCGGYPLTLPAHKLTKLSSINNFSGTMDTNSAIQVLGTIVGDTAAVWNKMSIPYVFTGTTIIGSFEAGFTRVTIMPGVICKYKAGACMRVGDPRFGAGALVAKGTIIDSIFFISNTNNAIWGDRDAGIWIGPESPNNTTLEYCSIKNATTGICAAGAKITVMNSMITGCDSYGIKFMAGGPADSLSFQNNFIIGNNGYGISIAAAELAQLSSSGSVAGNGSGGIYVEGNEVWQSGIWKKLDAPYIIANAIDIGNADGVEIIINPGTEFNFHPGAYIRVGHMYPGTLIAQGSTTSPIVFSSFIQNGYWGAGIDAGSGGIIIDKSADEKTVLENCTIRNATSGVNMKVNIKVQSCLIQNNQYYGIVKDESIAYDLVAENIYVDNGIDSVGVIP